MDFQLMLEVVGEHSSAIEGELRGLLEELEKQM